MINEKHENEWESQNWMKQLGKEKEKRKLENETLTFCVQAPLWCLIVCPAKPPIHFGKILKDRKNSKKIPFPFRRKKRKREKIGFQLIFHTSKIHFFHSILITILLLSFILIAFVVFFAVRLWSSASRLRSTSWTKTFRPGRHTPSQSFQSHSILTPPLEGLASFPWRTQRSFSSFFFLLFFPSDFHTYLLFWTQPKVNSLLLPDMVFHKPSDTFGQWLDPTSGDLYGLNFTSKVDAENFEKTFSDNLSKVAPVEEAPKPSAGRAAPVIFSAPFD